MAAEFDVLSLTPKLQNEAEWPWKPSPAASSGTAATTASSSSREASSAEECHDEGPLSFEEHLWDQFDHLWQTRVEPSQQLLEEVAKVLKDRADLERKYGEGLRGYTPHVQLNPQENSVHGAVNAVLVNFRNRGEQSVELADEIEHDIVATFLTVARQHKEVAKKIHSDMALLQKYCQDWRHMHDKLAKKYSSKCAEAEGAAQECLQSLGMKTVDRMKLGKQATTTSRAARVAEHEYYWSIEQANRARQTLDQQMPLMLSALQDMDEKRARCLKDGLMKLAVYETSWLRNLQYDLEATVKASEGADPFKDLQDFIRQHKSQTTRTEGKVTFSAQPFFQLKGKASAAAITPNKQQQVEVCTAVRQLIKDELLPLVHRLVVEDSPTEEMKEQLEQLRQGLGDPRRRVAVCQALRAEVLAREAEGVQLENAKPVQMAPAAFEAVVALFKACLDACDEQSDAWSGRDLMVLTQLFKSGTPEKTTQLLSRVYNHSLWNKVTFWEEVLVLGLCEAHSAESIWRRTLPAGSQFSQPSMTLFLERFVGYMMAFGISFDQGRNSVSATLKKHKETLGSTVKAYSGLLLHRYEEAAVPAPTSRTLEAEQAATAPVVGEDSTEMDDFEAVAMGVQATFSEASTSEQAVSGVEAAPAPAAEAEEQPAESLEAKQPDAVEDSKQAPEEDEDKQVLEVEGVQAAVREEVAQALVEGTGETAEGTEAEAKDGEAFKVMAAAQRSVSDVFG